MFGATEIGFIAARIATWYYRSGLGTVLAWTLVPASSPARFWSPCCGAA